MKISLQSNEDNITFKVIKAYRCMLNEREGSRERDFSPTPGNPRSRELGLLNLTNEFKMKQPFVIMIVN